MNRQYIKRQITLHKLGLPMNKDVKEYYDFFNRLLDINNLEEIIHDDYPDNIFWRKEGEVILQYDIKKEWFRISYGIVWNHFEYKYDMGYDTIKEIFSGMLGEIFNMAVRRTTFVDILIHSNSWTVLSK